VCAPHLLRIQNDDGVSSTGAAKKPSKKRPHERTFSP
jgi:hypothetical protein